MSASKLSSRLVMFVIVSLITHLTELATSGLFCYKLARQTDLRLPWFSLASGVLILPTVAVQLASAVFLLRRKTEGSTAWEVATAAVLHVFQLGFISRHFIVLKDAPFFSKRTEVIEMMLLRLFFAFTSGCTLFLMQVYLLLQGSNQQSWSWVLYLSGATTLISVAWGVSTFRRCLVDSDFGFLLISWPGTVLRLIWRAGEILARVIAAGLFASLYTHFLILVLGLHWFSMFVCLYIPPITSIEWSTTGCVKRTFICFMLSFAHIFAFVNTSSENSVFRYTFYSVIFLLENSTLLAVWFVQSSTDEFDQNNVFAYISVTAVVVSLTSLIIYYKFFHLATFKAATATCDNYVCVTCNHEEASSFHSVLTRRGETESWENDFVAESVQESDVNSAITANRSQANHHQNLRTNNDGLNENNSYHGKPRNDRINIFTLPLPKVEETTSAINRTERKTNKKYNNPVAPGLRMSSAKMDTELTNYNKSPKTPVWLPSGDSPFASELLTYGLNNFDASETVDSDRSSVSTGCSGYHNSCSSSPLNLASPQKTIASTSFLEIHGTISEGCNIDTQANPQNKLLQSSLNTSLASSSDSKKGRTSSFKLSHRVPGPLNNPASTSLKTDSDMPGITKPKCLHDTDTHHHFNHHHHEHHHNGSLSNIHLSTTNNNSLRFLQKQLIKSPPPNIPESVQGHSSTVTEHQSSPSCNRRSMPSTNDDKLNCDQNKINNFTSARRGEMFSSVGKFVSYPPVKDQPSIRKSTHLDDPCSKNKDLTLADSERLAVELLKTASRTNTPVHTEQSDTATLAAADPRLTIRVMTSPVVSPSPLAREIGENPLPHTQMVSNLHDLVGELHELRPRESKQPESNGGKIIVNIYDMPEIVTADQGTENNTKPPYDQTSDEMYEYLWPSEQVISTLCAKGSCGADAGEITARANLREVYACSESEDSALPHEMLSCSAEGVTVTDCDSVASLEIVI